MKNCRNLILLLLLAACNNEPKSQQAQDAATEVNKTDSAELYLRTGNPDTALAMFIYKNYQNFDAESHVEEYIRWDLENEKIKPILTGLYLKGGNKDSILSILQKNREAFRQKAAVKVLDGYKLHNKLSGQLFSYLIDIKDAIVVPMLQDILNNPKASAEEKRYAHSVLKKITVSK